MSELIKRAIKKINVLRDELQIDLAEIPNLVIRANHVLETLANGLSHTIGEAPSTQSSSFTPTPITNVLGDAISQPEKVDMKTINPSQADKEVLKKQAIEAYESFLNRDSNVILESVDDIIIRAVAKKAGMEVTSSIPGKVTIEFIDEIKKTIIAKEALEAVKSTGVVTNEAIANDSIANEIVENQMALFEKTFSTLADEYGYALEQQMTDEQKEMLKNGISELLNAGTSTDEMIQQFTDDTRKYFEAMKSSNELIGNKIDEMIELSRQLFTADGKEYTADMEAENRRLFADASIEELQKVADGLKAELAKKGTTAKAVNDTKTGTNTTKTATTNKRR